MPFWREEGWGAGGEFLPDFHLPASPLPLLHSLLKGPSFSERKKGLQTRFSVSGGFISVCTSSPASALYMEWKLSVNLSHQTPWELPDDGLCIPPARLQSSPWMRAGSVWEFPEPKDSTPPPNTWELSWDRELFSPPKQVPLGKDFFLHI